MIRKLLLLILLPFIAQAQISNQAILSQMAAPFNRTASEIAAGVTPTNYGYSPGDVRRYGADPTGVADSTTAVTRAISSLSSGNGGIVYFPKGVYKVSSVTITRQATVYGDGVGSTQIYATNASSDVFIVPSGVSSVTFRDFTMTASITRTNGRYFYAQTGSSQVILQNLYLLNWYYGIDFEGTDYSISNVEMRNGVVTNGQAVRIGFDPSPGSLADISIINLRIDNPSGSKPFACVAAGAAGDITLIDSQLQHCNRGLSVTPSGTSVVTSLLAVNSFFDNAGTYGIFLQPAASGAAIIRARFNGCWFSSAGTNGIFIDTSANGGNVDGITFIDPEVYLNGSDGISISGTGTKRVKVLGGAIAGNSGNGLTLGAGVTQFEMQDATSGLSGSVGPNTGWGAQILSGSGNNIVITGNDLCGNTTGSLVDASTGFKKVFAQNLCYSNYFTNAIPFIIPPTSTMGNNGADTLGTALPTTYSNAYFWFNSNQIFSGSAAGWYFTQCSTTTACTVFNNTYTAPGQPTIPASPTSFSSTGPGAITGVTTQTSGPQFSIPSGMIGSYGQMRVSTLWSVPNNANAKTVNINVGAVNILNASAASVGAMSLQTNLYNRGTQNSNVTFSIANQTGYGTASAAANFITVNFATSNTLVQAGTISTATDYLVMEAITVELFPNNPNP